MLKISKKTIKRIVKFAKPRVAAVMLIPALIVSVFLFLSQVNTFVIEFDGESKTVKSLSADIENAIDCAGIDTDNYKLESARYVDGKTVINLLRTFPVFITAGNETLEVGAFESETVAHLLNCAGFKVDEFDMVEPALDSELNSSTYIDYVNIDYVSGSYTQAVPYSVETVYSSDLEKGKRSTTPGKDGLEQVNYTQKLVNGEVKETKVNSKVTLLAAKNAVQTVGTRAAAVKTSTAVSTISQLSPASAIQLDSNGNPVNYKKHVTVQATAYTYTGHNCSTGVAPKPGYIAVNPRVIPYGTKMYIKSSDGRYTYGYAVAADTGGFIYSRPTNVDLFFPTVASCNAFGRRNVEIYILG